MLVGIIVLQIQNVANVFYINFAHKSGKYTGLLAKSTTKRNLVKRSEQNDGLQLSNTAFE